MRTRRSAAILATAAITGTLLLAGPAAAFPFSPAQATVPAKFGATPPTVQVRNHGGAIAAGVIGGLIVGGIIASHSQYYDYPPYGYAAPYPPYGYYAPYPAGDGAIAYCAQRFRSYDPMSGTYLGYDGYRHRCP